MYVATQIQRAASPDPATTAWSVLLDSGRTGHVHVPLEAYAAIEAGDPDAYAREALADHLSWRQPTEQELLAGHRVTAF